MMYLYILPQGSAPNPEKSRALDALNQMPSFGESALKTFVVLAVMVALLYITSRFARRWLNPAMRAKSAGMIELIDSLPLEAKKRLHIVKFANRYLLIGTTETSMELISESRANPDAVTPEPSIPVPAEPGHVFNIKRNESEETLS